MLAEYSSIYRFFEDNPTAICNCAAGNLVGIQDITARKLYDAYYGGKSA